MRPDFEDWREVLLRNNEPESAGQYVRWAKRYEEWRDPGPAGVEGLRGFDAFLRDGDAVAEAASSSDALGAWGGARPPSSGYSYRSRVVALSAAKGWAEFAHGAEFSGRREEMVQNLVRGSEPAFDPDIASADEVARVLGEADSCREPACGAMCRVGYDAILRGCELVALDWGDFDLDTGTVWVEGAKGSMNRHVRLADSTVEAVREYRRRAEGELDDPGGGPAFHVWHRSWSGNRWHRASWSRHFREEHWDGGFHAFARNTAITRRLEAGESLTSVSARARHTDREMTSRYQKLVGEAGAGLEELE